MNQLDAQYRTVETVLANNFTDIRPDPSILEMEVSSGWWDLLAELGITLYVSHEHEHFVSAHGIVNDTATSTYYLIAHPCGMAFDEYYNLHIASTRNPNTIHVLKRHDGIFEPQHIHFYPGNARLHELYYHRNLNSMLANATGWNCVCHVGINGRLSRKWQAPLTDQKDTNHRVHLNSIGHDINSDTMYYSAFSESPLEWDKTKSLDKSGVIFSESTSDVVCRGLTAPHSVRWHDGKLWVCDSGYGTFGYVNDCGVYHSVAKFNGWTRGVHFQDNVAFIGVSRVILDKARQYAPGFENTDRTECAVYAFDINNGIMMEYAKWPNAYHIFDVTSVPTSISNGFAFGLWSDERIYEWFYQGE